MIKLEHFTNNRSHLTLLRKPVKFSLEEFRSSKFSHQITFFFFFRRKRNKNSCCILESFMISHDFFPQCLLQQGQFQLHQSVPKCNG